MVFAVKDESGKISYNAPIDNPVKWKYDRNPRIVCAANKLFGSDVVVIGIRHHDKFMNRQITITVGCNITDVRSTFARNEIQGFVDQYGNFYTRKEAWKIANMNNQIIRRVGGDEGCLYSENLY